MSWSMPNGGTDLETIERALTRSAHQLHSSLLVAAILALFAGMDPGSVAEGLNLQSKNLSGPALLLHIFEKLNLTQCLKDAPNRRPLTRDHRRLIPDQQAAIAPGFGPVGAGRSAHQLHSSLLVAAILALFAGMNHSGLDEGVKLQYKNLSGPARSYTSLKNSISLNV